MPMAISWLKTLVPDVAATAASAFCLASSSLPLLRTGSISSFQAETPIARMINQTIAANMILLFDTADFALLTVCF